ncbi:MAG: DUF2334 domain-containing protein, partial [Desulfocapsaceae bacterium]
GLDLSTSCRPIPVLFRADDIGVLSTNFLRMLDLFQTHHLPLCLAVVPTWLSQTRWRAIKTHIDTGSPLWCWHQHGWNHTNHQSTGKKCEFGSARSRSAISNDLSRGKDRLLRIVGSDYSPFFTPPWNRCSEETLAILAELGFSGVSRSRGEQGENGSLKDFFINVDLHTRKETDGGSALEGLCDELRLAVEQHYVSVMIHHQLMNDSAFELLELLLTLVAGNSKFRACTFNDLRGQHEPDK